MSRFARRRETGNRGFTLTELLVVITIMGIIGLIVGTAIISGLHKQTQVQDRNDALVQARTALQRVDRDIRSSNPLKCATATQLVMAEVSTTATTWLTYSVIAQSATRSELVVDKTATACGAVATPTSRTVLLTNLVNTTTNPVFTFSTGTVTVNVQVQPTTLTQPVVLSDNGVDLRNAT